MPRRAGFLAASITPAFRGLRSPLQRESYVTSHSPPGDPPRPSPPGSRRHRAPSRFTNLPPTRVLARTPFPAPRSPLPFLPTRPGPPGRPRLGVAPLAPGLTAPLFLPLALFRVSVLTRLGGPRFPTLGSPWSGFQHPRFSSHSFWVAFPTFLSTFRVISASVASVKFLWLFVTSFLQYNAEVLGFCSIYVCRE